MKTATQRRYADNRARGFEGPEAWGKRGARGLTPRELLIAPDGVLTTKERRYRRALIGAYDYAGSDAELKAYARSRRISYRVLRKDVRSVDESRIPRRIPLILKGGMVIAAEIRGRKTRNEVRNYWRSVVNVIDGKPDSGVVTIANQFGTPVSIGDYDVETDIDVLTDLYDSGALDDLVDDDDGDMKIKSNPN